MLYSDYVLNQNRSIHADYAHKHHIYGAGVTVCVLDSGITPRSDFMNIPLPSRSQNQPAKPSRILYFKDFVNHRDYPYDDAGHGSHICGKIASNIQIAPNQYLGIAPACNLVVLKVLDQNGNAPISTFLAALRWVRQHHREYQIRIVNISIGANISKQSAKNHILVRAVEELWSEGLVVCASAGNNGPTPSSITAPGNSCSVITVGAYDDSSHGQSQSQESIHASDQNPVPHQYSGRGPLPCPNVKPELVAPGNQIISCANQDMGYVAKTGTSMSTAFVSGGVALLLEQEPMLTNEDVKRRLAKATRRLNLAHFHQGWGVLDIQRLLES